MNTSWRRPLAGLLPLLGLLTVAAPASASSFGINYNTGKVVFHAAAGEANAVTIAPKNASSLRLQDPGAGSVSLTQVGGLSACGLLQAISFLCPANGLTTASIALGDGEDSFDDSSTALATTVSAGPGVKEITTGSGNDVIDVRNGSVDKVSCGAGDDTVYADPQDKVSSDCEHVDRGSATAPPVANPIDGSLPGSTGTRPGTGDGSGSLGAGTDSGSSTGSGSAQAGGDAASTVFQTPLGLTLPASTVDVPRPNVAVVALGCSAAAEGGCQGEIVFEALPSAASPAAHHAGVVAARGHFTAQQRAQRGRRLGRSTFKLAPGESAKLPVRIAYRGHFALASKRHSRAVMRVVERDSTGKVVDTQTRVVTLKARTNKWSRIRRRR